MLTKEQIDFFLIKAYNAAVRAGARVLDIFTEREPVDPDSLPKTSKIDRTPLTAADAESHKLIKEYLSQTRIPMLSAEGRNLLYEERRNWDLFWMVDPLDGSKEFVKGNGEFTINIALMVDNKPSIAVIYVPYLHKLYFALCGQGAYLKNRLLPDADHEASVEQLWKNCKPLPLRKKSNDPIFIAISRSHNTDETFEHVNRIKRKHAHAVVVEQGSSYKFCLLAEATVDTYVRTSPTYEWDTAAGELILREAGGVLHTLDGEPFRYNKESVVNPHFICKNKFLIEA